MRKSINVYNICIFYACYICFLVVLVRLAQLVRTMHNICKVWGLNLDHHKKNSW